jgi:hypothetical protein
MLNNLKTTLFLVTFLLSSICVLAQNKEIAVQGIARDAGGSARSDLTLVLDFKIYDINNASNPIVNEPKTVVTDEYGVFSTTITITEDQALAIGTINAYLKISEGGTTISDESLKSVPYAISAQNAENAQNAVNAQNAQNAENAQNAVNADNAVNAENGVPTGSIMPYMGSTAPEGWLLCDGATITDPNGDALKALLGEDRTPNLQGMFLRGTGNNTVNNQPGPAIGETQADAFKEHDHGYKDSYLSENTNFTGYSFENRVGGDGPGSGSSDTNNDRFYYVNRNTNAVGDNETRPVNYGVNYIIKL